MPPPLREQLASGAAIRELQGEGARGVSCRQPEQRPRAATVPAPVLSAQAGSPRLEWFALRYRIPRPHISDSHRLPAGCILRCSSCLVFRFLTIKATKDVLIFKAEHSALEMPVCLFLNGFFPSWLLQPKKRSQVHYSPHSLFFPCSITVLTAEVCVAST